MYQRTIVSPSTATSIIEDKKLKEELFEGIEYVLIKKQNKNV